MRLKLAAFSSDPLNSLNSLVAAVGAHRHAEMRGEEVCKNGLRLESAAHCDARHGPVCAGQQSLHLGQPACDQLCLY